MRSPVGKQSHVGARNESQYSHNQYSNCLIFALFGPMLLCHSMVKLYRIAWDKETMLDKGPEKT
jgi:hypothetical protein